MTPRRHFTHQAMVSLTKAQHQKLTLTAMAFGISSSEVIRRFLRPLWEIPLNDLILKGLVDEIKFTSDQAMNALKRTPGGSMDTLSSRKGTNPSAKTHVSPLPWKGFWCRYRRLPKPEDETS